MRYYLWNVEIPYDSRATGTADRKEGLQSCGHRKSEEAKARL